MISIELVLTALGTTAVGTAGATVSTRTETVLVASTCPAASAERYLSVDVPSADTVNGPEYRDHAAPLTAYCV